MKLSLVIALVVACVATVTAWRSHSSNKVHSNRLSSSLLMKNNRYLSPVLGFAVFLGSPNVIFSSTASSVNSAIVVSGMNAIADDTVPTLSASDVLQADIKPRVDLLQDIFFIFKLLPNYLENNDYASIRKSLRQDPVIELRKTCKKLEKYLPATEMKNFDKAYGNMIDAVNDLDVVSIFH